MAGGMIVARSVSDHDLRREILDRCFGEVAKEAIRERETE
jgi:hypothetical protein